MQIKNAESTHEKEQLDELLWNVLWQPLGLPRDIRDSFKLEKPEINLIAVENDHVLDGLVANYLSNKIVEIRHLAVKEYFQRHNIGKNLIETLIEQVTKADVKLIQTIARNTSVEFWAKLGFIPQGAYITHPDFTTYGIKFIEMILKLS